MAHFALLCPENGGHLFPVGSLGVELARRGHRVTVVARADATPIVERLGLPFHEVPAEVNSLLRLPPRPVQAVCWALGVFPFILLRRGLRWRITYFLDVLPAILRELAPDALLIDQLMLGGSTLSEHVGVPCVTVCSSLHWLRDPAIPPMYTGWPLANGRCGRWRDRTGYAGWDWYIGPAIRLLNRRRRALGMAPVANVDGLYSPYATLAQTCPEFDFPRAPVPDTFHYVGALTSERPDDETAFPWDRLDGRPLIYASLGTVDLNQRRRVFRAIAAACSRLDAQVVISAGRWEKDDRRRSLTAESLPGDPLVVPFAPQLALLDRARLLVTHAGQNTTVEALGRGLPMVALPQGMDQFAIAARIEQAGVGLRVRRGGWDAVERVFHEESFRQRARILQEAMVAAGGVRRAADIAEQVCETRRPVLRKHADS